MHLVRKVLPYEYPKYRDHLKSLDAESRVLRFGFPAKDEHIDKLCDSIEAKPNEHILFCVEDINLKFIGIGHIALDNSMELAFSVSTEHRNQGIGNALMDRIVQYCRTHNMLKGHMVCLSTNSAIKKMCRKHGITMENDHGETTGHIELNIATPKTFFDEQVSAHAAILDYVIKRTFIPWSISPAN